MIARLAPQLVVPAGAARPRSEEEQAAFFAAALDRTRSAEARVAVVERCFRVADAVLCLRFASQRLAQSFTPALSHLEVPAPAGAPDAVFHVWDSRSTGVDMVPPPFTQDCLTARGEIWTMASRRFRSAWLWSEYALNLFDGAAATGIYWTPSPGPLPEWAKASPLRCLLHWWAQTRGGQLVHAAAVGDERGAVLITGRSGVGKSTAALACLERGLSYLGDDYVLLQLDPAPRVHSLYATAKLERQQLTGFPHLGALEGGRDSSADDKAVLFLHPARRDQLPASLPLRAVVTPRLAGRPQTELETIVPGELRRAASLTTLAQLPGAGPEARDFIARLVGRLPGHRLALGSDLGTVGPAIAGLLARSAAAGERPVAEAGCPPLVSVIILVSGDSRLLADSLAGVLAQADADTEILLVEDGRSADIGDVVSRLPVEARRLRQDQGGPAAACNRGLRECAGTLVTFLRAGDRWPDGTLRMMIDGVLSDGGCDAVRGFDASGGPAAALYRREAFERVGPFHEWLWDAEQSDWFDRARTHGLTLRRLAGATLVARPRKDDESRRLRHDRGMLRRLKAMLDRDRPGGSSAG